MGDLVIKKFMRGKGLRKVIKFLISWVVPNLQLTSFEQPRQMKNCAEKIYQKKLKRIKHILKWEEKSGKQSKSLEAMPEDLPTPEKKHKTNRT